MMINPQSIKASPPAPQDRYLSEDFQTLPKPNTEQQHDLSETRRRQILTTSVSMDADNAMKNPLLGYQTRVNLGRIAALPVNMAIYFAFGTYSKSVGNAMKARESRVASIAVPVSFLAGALTGGAQGAGLAVKDTVQIMRGKKSRRETLMIV